MPNFKGHIAGGLSAYCAAALLLSLGHVTLMPHFPWIAATLAGAIFPDIDIRSKGQRLYLKVLVLILLFCLLSQAYIPFLAVLLFSFLPLILPHRGLFHNLAFVTLLLVVLTSLIILLIPAQKEAALITSSFFLLGVISHLVLDKGFKKTFLLK